MPDRRDVASWLPGSGSPRSTPGGGSSRYPGQDLRRPPEGSGSIPGIGRRLAALLIDWIACLLITRAIFGPAAGHPPGALWTNVIFAIENVVLIGTAGATFGQRILSLRVETVDGGKPGLGAALLRAVLLALGLPALTVLWERDQRGLHELATGTLVARR